MSACSNTRRTERSRSSGEYLLGLPIEPILPNNELSGKPGAIHSTRLSTLGDHSTQSAKKRNTELPALKRELTGDLDWITLKALEKDRTRRYSSPQDLAADIERYLTDQPVLASPPSMAYRAKKFVKRHTWGVAAATIGVLTLIAFAGTMAVQAKRIAFERDLAQQAQAELESVVEFQAGMLSATDPEEMGRRLMENLSGRVAELKRGSGSSEEQVSSALASLDTLVTGVNSTDLALDLVDKDILTAALHTLDEKFGDLPKIDARLRGTIGNTYRKLGRYEPAEPQLTRALEIRKRVLGDDHPNTLVSMNNLANLYRNQGRYADAEPLYLATLETQKRVLGADHPDTLLSMNSLALLYWNQGRYADAEPLYLATLEARKRVLGADHPDTLLSMNSLAILYQSQGRYADAEPLYLATLETQKRVLGADQPHTLTSMNNLAILYQSQGRYADAEPLYLTTLETRKRVLGADHPDTLASMGNLASLYADQGRYADAEPLYLETLETLKRVLGADHPDTGVSLHNLACLYRDTGRYVESRSFFERTLRVDEKALGPDHPYVAEDLVEYAKLLRKMGEDAEAARMEARAKAITGE